MKVLPGEVFDDRRFLKFRGRPWAQAAGEEEGPELGGAGLACSAAGERERVSEIHSEWQIFISWAPDKSREQKFRFIPHRSSSVPFTGRRLQL